MLNENIKTYREAPLSIEEQIDEYIAYKRGLNKNASQSTFNEQKSTTMQTEIADKEEYLNLLEKRPEMKKLFSASKNATIEEIEQVIKLFETFQRESKVE